MVHDQEGHVGEWKTVYEDEVEERWVTLKVYESEDAEDEDYSPVVRVTIAPIDDEANEPEQIGDESKHISKVAAEDNSITLDPDAVEDLEEELIEIGFSPEAVRWILSKIPD
ncbi:hypothetical protein FHR70_004436 [Microvirga lupini]|uniref:Uncharacterized protein n=1 Tax=Microvirga lupini TaxID=420324 RepID=A0A7W4VQ95_9HYPH|nr:hypothetical protein [Microvirga lupini]MBB3021340.1 hypothetical protein [Microvirga lupini]